MCASSVASASSERGVASGITTKHLSTRLKTHGNTQRYMSAKRHMQGTPEMHSKANPFDLDRRRLGSVSHVSASGTPRASAQARTKHLTAPTCFSCVFAFNLTSQFVIHSAPPMENCLNWSLLAVFAVPNGKRKEAHERKLEAIDV